MIGMADISSSKPPDITSNRVNRETASQNALPKINKNRRSIPVFMDPHNMHGDVEYLLLQGVGNTPLPRKPLIIETTVELAAGGPIDSARSESRGARYTLQVRSRSQVEKLLKLTKLTDGTPVEVIYHPSLNKCRCVVTDWEMVDTDLKEIENYLAKQNVTEVRRVTRRTPDGNVENTGIMILTCKGTVPPEHIKLGLQRIPTRPFYPSPLLCYRCFSYGHAKVKCSKGVACRNCSEPHEIVDSDGQVTCGKPAYCKNCEKNHSPSSRSCPAYRREVEIIRIKVDEGLTYPEAREAYQNRVTASKGTYANAVQQRLTNAQSTNEEISNLTQLLKQKDEANKILQQENRELRKQVADLQKSLNQVLENQAKLQEQFNQLMQQMQKSHEVHTDLSHSQKTDLSSVEHASRKKFVEPHRMQTRQQSRSASQSSTSRDSESKNSHKKRGIPNVSVKPPKIQKNAAVKLSFSNDEADLTQHDINIHEISEDSDRDQDMTGISN